MAVGQGFSKVVTSGSVFHYDTGDMINSFKGKPGTNSLAGIIRNYNGYSLTNYTNGKLFETNGYTETVNIPALGTRTVESVEIYNVYSGYGTDGNYNCCPSLFNYSNGWLNTPLSGSTLYMYEIIYKCESGYTNPNYMYHYEYRADNTYNTEYGLHDDSRRISLGDGWYYAWGSFTTQATTAKGYFGLWYYYYNVRDKVSVASISLQQGDSVLPPRQLIPNATTRSNTQGLLDLTGTYSIDLSNISFNSTGNVVFDGTNDYISLNSFNPNFSAGITMECVAYWTSSPGGSWQRMFDFGNGASVDNLLFCRYSSTDQLWFGIYNGGATSYVLSNTGAILFGQYALYTATADGTNFKIYVNGSLIYSGANSTIPVTTPRVNNYLGKSNWPDSYFNGQIPTARIYNRALTAGEIKQNYNHYKTRFNLP